MKRYRVLSFDFDSRPASLKQIINPSWEPKIQEQHWKNQITTVAGLLGEFGTYDAVTKLQDFVDLGNAPLSVIAFHNRFLRQVRTSFVAGAYYPALVGTCTLGERILNHLVIKLRESFRDSPEYRRVAKKESFDNWKLAIDTLEAWEVLLPEVTVAFRKLEKVRNRKAVHFNPEVDSNERTPALEAIQLLSKIIGQQFGSFGAQPWFISGILGASFIKKEAEEWPFIQAIYIQTRNCVLVGPYHKVDVRDSGDGYKFFVTDDDNYEHREITDEEFAKLYENR